MKPDTDIIMAVSCSQRHTAAVTEDGKLWVWVARDDYQLGLTSLKYRPLPTSVGVARFATRFVMLSAGDYHLSAIVADGAVWKWDQGTHVRLGHGDEQARSTLTRLDKEAFGGSVAVIVA